MSHPAASDVITLLTTVLAKTGSFDPRLAEMWAERPERDQLSQALAEKNAPPDLLEFAKNLKEVFPF